MTISLGVLISGRGSNLRAIAESINRGDLDASVEVVISNRSDAAGLHWAQSAGLRTSVLSRSELPDRAQRQRAMGAVLDASDVDLVVLAGFDEILESELLEAYSGRIISIHPSLLPSFGGTMHAVAHAFEYGVKVTGCTVHFVTTNVDGGPIIVQRAIEVREVDTVKTLAERILAEEHQALPEAIGLIASSRLRLDGRRVVIS